MPRSGLEHTSRRPKIRFCQPSIDELESFSTVETNIGIFNIKTTQSLTNTYSQNNLVLELH